MFMLALSMLCSKSAAKLTGCLSILAVFFAVEITLLDKKRS
jgi:hypothetical protein